MKPAAPTSGVDAFLDHASGVIHIGANTGQERKVYAAKGLNVAWVEPIPDVFAELEANLQGMSRQRAYRYLLTDRDGDRITLNIANNGGASSSIFDLKDHRKIWPEVHYTGSLEMTSTTFRSFAEAESLDLGAYDALVLDTQGAELLVLQGAGQLLEQFRFIKTEAADFESYAGCCKLDDLTDYVARFGFRKAMQVPFAGDAQKGQYYEVLYERDA
ncbi:FkbM family methyltransferase [Roseovarius spongiae]|nr:FkbM family methyltransferase [Roseovarius spongiae]